MNCEVDSARKPVCLQTEGRRQKAESNKKHYSLKPYLLKATSVA
jgi:hypothetical protein